MGCYEQFITTEQLTPITKTREEVHLQARESIYGVLKQETVMLR